MTRGEQSNDLQSNDTPSEGRPDPEEKAASVEAFIKCDRCGFENKHDAKYCQECGAKLSIDPLDIIGKIRESWGSTPKPRSIESDDIKKLW